MLISCLCPTFNRYPRLNWLLEEALESFLRQDYADKELIIGNDTPGQTLEFDHPQVRVVNFDARWPALSDKIQAMIDLAKGEALCRWDDDDIHLPWRLSLSAKKLADRLEWRAGNYFYSPGTWLQEVHHPGNTHVQALWRREVLAQIGGRYPAGRSGNEDQLFNQALTAAGISGPRGEVLPADRCYYIYRWATGSMHLSGRLVGPADNPHQAHYDHLGRQPIVCGHYALRPHWTRNYTADVAQAARLTAQTSRVSPLPVTSRVTAQALGTDAFRG